MREVNAGGQLYQFPDNSTPEQVESFFKQEFGNTQDFDFSGLYTPQDSVEASSTAFDMMTASFVGGGEYGADIGRGIVGGAVQMAGVDFMGALRAEAGVMEEIEEPIEKMQRLGVWFEDVPFTEKVKHTLPILASRPPMVDMYSKFIGKYTNIDDMMTDGANIVTDLSKDILDQKLFEYKNQVAYDLGSAISSLAISAGLYALNPALVVPIFGAIAKGSLYDTAMESGEFDKVEANALGDIGGTLIGLAELAGDHFIFGTLKGSNPLWRGFLAGSTEALTEMTQNVIEDSLTNITGLTQKTIGEVAQDALYAGVLAMITGGGYGSFAAAMDKRGARGKLKEMGIVVDQSMADTIYDKLYDVNRKGVKEALTDSLNGIYDKLFSDREIVEAKEPAMKETEIVDDIGGISEEASEISGDESYVAQDEDVQKIVESFGVDVFGSFSPLLKELSTITEKINEYTKNNKPIPNSLQKRKQAIINSIDSMRPKHKSLKNIKRIIKENIKPTSTIVLDEGKLLKWMMQEKSRVAKQAYNEAKRVVTESLKRKFKDKTTEISSIKKDAIAYVNTFMPTSIRGKVLNKVNSLKTRKGLSNIFKYIDQQVESHNKKKSIDKYKKLIRKVKESTTIAPEYRDAILSFNESVATGEAMPSKRIEAIKNILTKAKSEGIVSAIPLSIIDELGKKSLSKLSSEKINVLNDVVAHLAKLGRLKKKLSKLAHKRDIENVVDELKTTLSENGFNLEDKGDLLPNEEKKKTLMEKVNNFFNGLAKLEFLFDEFDGYKGTDGLFYKTFYKPLYDAQNKLFVLKERDSAQINKFLDEYKKATNLHEEIIVGKHKFTRQEILGLYANSKNDGNRSRLFDGYTWLTEDIFNEAMSKLDADDLLFVDSVMEMVQRKAPMVRKVLEELTGESFVDLENYFPIVYMGDLESYNVNDEDFKYMFQQITQQRDMTKKRGVGTEQRLNLDFMHIVMNHLDKVNNFITHALVAQDMRVLLGNPDLAKAMSSAKGEDMYRTVKDIYKNIFNPQIKHKSFTEKKVYGVLNLIKSNVTKAALGVNPLVSMIQFGSYFNAIPEVGLREMLDGTNEYFADIGEIRAVIEQLSVQQKNRAVSLDRELREFISSEQGKKFLQGKKYSPSTLFALIHAVDNVTSNSVWWSAFKKKMSQTSGNQAAAVEYADSVVRTTQPMMLAKDMPSMMQQGGVMRLLTWFFSHWSTTGNVWGKYIHKNLKGRPDKEKMLEAFGVLIYTLVIPALFSGLIKNGFTLSPGKALKSLAGYATAPIPGVRDAMSYALYGFQGNPLLRPFIATADVIKSLGKVPEKGLQPLVVDSIDAYGMWTGKIPGVALSRTVDGLFDLLFGETDDLRRVLYSEWALKE